MANLGGAGFGQLGGIIPPVVTPLDATGELDRRSLERVVGRLLEAGVDGLFALGSTGEMAHLSDATRRGVVEVVCSVVAGQVPVVVGVMDTSPARVVDTVRSATSGLAVDALVVTAPFYGRVQRPEIELHFRAVAAAVDRPVVAYDVPAAVHVPIGFELLRELAVDEVLVGLKDSTGAESQVRRLLNDSELPPTFAVLTGAELNVDSLLLAGAHGAVPGLANVDPDGYVALFRAVHTGDVAAAHRIQRSLIDLFELALVGSADRMGPASAGVGGFKAALCSLGVIETPLLAAPHVQLNQAELDGVASVVAAHLSITRAP